MKLGKEYEIILKVKYLSLSLKQEKQKSFFPLIFFIYFNYILTIMNELIKMLKRNENDNSLSFFVFSTPWLERKMK